MRKFSVLLAALLFMGASAVFGQEHSVSGKVLDSDSGDPLVGVSVEVVGAQIGTSTDDEGKFTISLPDGYTKLKIEQTSYNTQELVARDGMVVRLVLSAELLKTAEVEVAMGTKKGKGYVGSAQTVTSEAIEKKSPSDITKALSGEFAGVQIATSTGQPGVASSVRIRGISSLRAGSGALYVVDGIPYGNDISAIDPSDIVSTTVLKDATATSLYGARGSNGVILITTKKGTAGSEGKIEVDVRYGLNFRLIPMHDVITSPEQYMEVSWQGMYNFYRQGAFGPGTSGASLSDSRIASEVNKNLWTPEMTGMPRQYNLWDSKTIIDPATGKFKDGVARKYEPESWFKNMFHTAQKFSAGVRMSGGSDKTTYYTSINFLNDEGYYIQSDFKRLTALANLDYSPKKWLTANFKAQYAYSTSNNVGQDEDAGNNGFYFVNMIPPIYPVFQHNADGSVAIDPYTGKKAYDYGQYKGYARPFMGGLNPAGALRLDKSLSVTHNLSISNVFKFEFVKDLLIIITNGYNYYSGENSNLMNMFYGDGQGLGRIYKTNVSYMDFTTRQQISYKKTFGSAHNFDIMAGHDFRSQQSKSMFGNKAALLKPNDIEFSNAVQVKGLSSSATDYLSESYMAELRYNYEEKYFAIVNGSVYGSSYFAPRYRYGAFWSVGAAWNIHRETFMSKSRKWLTNLKLKASFGTTGNDQIGNHNFLDRYTISNLGGEPAVLWQTKSEPTLTWETSYKFNAGIEFEIKKGRLYGELEVYNDYVINNLNTRAVAPSLGYTSIPINQGKYRNFGVELLLRSTVVKTNNFELNLRFTGSHFGTKVVELPKEFIFGRWIEMSMNGRLAKGHSTGDIYSSKYLGVDPTNGWGIWEKVYDATKGTENTPEAIVIDVYDYKNRKTVRNGEVDYKNKNMDLRYTKTSNANEAATDFIGKNIFPKFQGGFGFDFSTYGIDFSASFNYIIGGYNMDVIYANLMADNGIGNSNYHKDILKAWSPFASEEMRSSTNVPALFNGYYARGKEKGKIYQASYSTSGDRFLTPNTGLQLANIRIGYNFPKKLIEKIKLNTLSLWVSADNLFVVSHRRGYNPFSYLNGGNEVSQYAPLSTVMGGLKLTF